jgi:hypothetical protein
VIIDFDSLARASTAAHAALGAGLFLLGASEAYAHDNPGSRLALAGPLALLASAVAVPLTLLGISAAWDLEQLRAVLDARRGFYLFIALACLYGSAGLSRLTQLAARRDGGGWQAAFLVFLAASGALYFMMAWRVNEEAWRQVLAWHAAIGAAVLLAAAAKAAAVLTGRRALHFAWCALLMIAALQLLTYREVPGAFGLRMVSLQSSPELPPAAPKK